MIGMKLLFTVAEPWVFETNNGFSSFEVIIEAVKGSSLLLKANDPIRVDKCEYRMLVCSPRLEGVQIDEIVVGTSISCSVTCLSNERASQSNPFDLSWWRGGGALLGSVCRL